VTQFELQGAQAKKV